MRVLIACEFSGVVRDEFAAIPGVEAWSCDLLPCEKARETFLPDRHFRCDVRDVIGDGWDLMIAFPPCTHLAVSGARWFPAKRKSGEQQAAIVFFMALANAPIARIAIENPVGIMSTHWRKPDQIIQPWQFGHGEVKATCLWLKGLPLLKPSKIVSGRTPRVHHASPGPNRWKERSRTLSGIAKAMSQQWMYREEALVE